MSTREAVPSNRRSPENVMSNIAPPMSLHVGLELQALDAKEIDLVHGGWSWPIKTGYTMSDVFDDIIWRWVTHDI